MLINAEHGCEQLMLRAVSVMQFAFASVPMCAGENIETNVKLLRSSVCEAFV